MFFHFAPNLSLGSNAEGKHQGGKAWAQFFHCVSLSRYLTAQVAFHPRHPPSTRQRSCPGGLSGRSLLLVPALQKLCFVGSHSHPLAEARAGRESMTSQEPHESNSCSPWICSSYTVSTDACSAKEIKAFKDSKDFLESQLINDMQRVELINW